MKDLLKELAIKILTVNYFVIKKIIKKELNLKKNEKILDLGCGTGILAYLFSPDQYVGIDIDPCLISYAQKKNPKYSFKTMNSAKLDFQSHFFDKVLIVGVIHHLDKNTAQKTLDKIKHILKKNGVIVIIEAIPPIYSWNIVGRVFRKFDEGHHILSLYDYNKLLSRIFTVVRSYKKASGIFDYGVFVIKNSKR